MTKDLGDIMVIAEEHVNFLAEEGWTRGELLFYVESMKMLLYSDFIHNAQG